MIQIIPIQVSADIRPGDDLAELIIQEAEKSSGKFLAGDILAIAQKVVSKAEGRIVDLANVLPSSRATYLAKIHRKDPRLVEIILQESAQIVKSRNGVIIAETRHGFVCANAGVDQSNAEGVSSAILLPLDPDKSASEIKSAVNKICNVDIAVIVTDTFGRPFRNGQTNVAIGVAGIAPIKNYIGSEDMYGRKLRVTEIAIADEIASAAELVMHKADRVPAAIVRGYRFDLSDDSGIKTLLRNRESDLFR